MGKVILTCGHEDLKKPLGWHIYTKEWDVDGPCLAYSSICSSCFAKRILEEPEEIWTDFSEADFAIWDEANYGQEE